jgi:aspartyl aminopeptidase
MQGQEGAVERTLRQSFLISADMAHALHPNYTDKHDSLMAPAFQGGLVLKHNNNQRYATNAISAALFRWVGVVQFHPEQAGYLTKARCWQEGRAVHVHATHIIACNACQEVLDTVRAHV